MIRIFKLVVLLVISQVAFGQAPSNYTNINGRYRWIAGMFDSTFHIPKGSTPSLRTGGSTNSGGLFYNTSDSSVYTYTGTQWIKLRGSINPSDTTNKYVTQVYKKSGSDSIFYVKGGTHTWAFNDSTGSPGGGGGGKIYYFNGGVSMGTISGLQMYELGDTANTGTAANFTRSTTGNIANFITDPGKPGLLQIPAGVWSVDAWLSETGGGANHAEIWIEVEKWDGSTITTIATSPIEQITEGATPNLYSWSVSIPTTSLTVTDRIIIQFYISNTNGKTVTLYTQNGYVGEVHTTFTTGIGAINGLTAPAQYLVTGTSGTDFNISSATATHTFNLPTASATNRGALSTTDWSTFNNKIGGSLVSGYLTKATGTNTIDTSQIYQSSGNIGIGTTSIASGYKVDMVGSLRVGNGSSYNNITINGNSGAGSYIRFQKNGTNKGDIGPYSAVLGGVPPYSGSNDDLTYSSVGGHFFNTNAGIKMYLTNAGNLGLSASPDSMLTVLEGAYFQRGVRMSGLPTGVGTKAVRINANGTLSVADTLANGISGTGTTNYIPKFTSSSAIGNSQIFDNGTSVGIGTTATNANEKLRVDGGRLVVLGGSDVYQLKLAYNNATAGFWLGSPSANALAFYNDAGTERMRLDASGNLGLGTSAPANILDIYNTNGFQNRIRITGTTNTSQLQFSNTGGDFYLGIDNSTASGFGVGGYSRVLYSSNAYPMVFFTNALERMRLDANGRLGIGISSPSAFSILDANGQIRVSNLSVQGFYQARTSDVAGSGVFGGSSFVLRNGATSEDLNFDIFNRSTSAWYTAMIIKNSTGNVGIGTSSPYAILDLGASGVANNMILRNTTSAFNLGYIGNAGGRVDIGFSNSNSSLVALPYLSVTSGGSVGIGTTSPNSILQIKGAFNIERSNTTDYSIIDNEGNLNIKAATGGGGGSFNTVFFTGGSERMRITSGGYLLLGTTTSAYGQAGRGTFEMNGTTDNILVQKVNNTLANYIFSDATKTEFYSTNFLQLSVNGSERMRITSSGELLINTTSDAGDYKLQVNGNSYLASSTYTSGAILYLRDAIATGSNTSFAGLLLGSSPGTDYVIGKQSTNAVGTLAIKTGAGSTLLTLDASGNQELTGSIKTAAPSGGTAVPWKLGNKLSTAVTLDTGNYIPVEVNGVTYYLALVTLN